MEIIPEQYICDICGRISTNKNQIVECESRGEPVPLVREGDIIYFKDCQETPIYHNYIHDKTPSSGMKKDYASHMDYLYHEEHELYRHITMSYLIGSDLREWIVSGIKINGHRIEYHLVTKPGRNRLIYGSPLSYEIYPVIKSNEEMLKILDLYNK